MTLLHLSANELSFLVQCSLKSLGFATGDQINAGIRVAICYRYGMVNSSLVAHALQHLKPHVQAPELVSKRNGWVFDAKSQPALVQSELGLGAGLSNGAKIIRIRNTSEGIFAFPILMNWLKKPMTKDCVRQEMFLYFFDTINGKQRCLHISAMGNPLGMYEPLTNTVESDELVLQVGKRDMNAPIVCSEARLSCCYERSLDAGIAVEEKLFMHLRKMAMASFVPESENSRMRGAGAE